MTVVNIKSKGVTSSTMTITPELATQWLEGNTHNRPIRPKDVATYTASMERGAWTLNGESIIFSDDGRLLDGQHRLWACVESQKTFESIVVLGVPESVFTTIDQGKARTHADHLFVAHVNATPTQMKFVAATALLILRYRTNNVFSKLAVPAEQVIKLVQKEPAIVDWTIKARRAPAGLRSFSTPIAATMHLGSVKHPAEADVFIHRWTTGADLQNGSPILTLRQRVLANPPHLSPDRLFLVASAWNAFIQQRPMMKMGSMRGDNFPKIAGTK